MKNLIRREQFPYTSAFGWQYDSGDYHTAMNKAMETVGYKKLRDEQKAKREAFKRGETRELMGIGVAFFTEIVGAGPSRACDILGIAMFDSAEIRIHPTGSGICRLGTKSQGQGHETTYAQIIATELGLAGRQHHGRGGQHRHRALRPRHLRLALDAGVGRRDRHGLPQDQGQGADDRRLYARSARRRSRMGRRPLPRQGQSRALQDHDRARLGGLSRGAARHGAGPRGDQLLRSAELHLPVRRLHLRASTSTSTPARPRSAASTRSTIAARASIR